MLTSLSRTDLKLLKLLQVEGGLTNVEVAERIGMSASPCLRRVRQLETAGIIAGYVARLDRRAIGLDIMAMVEVRVDRHHESVAEAFRTAIERESSVIECYTLTGAFDYLLKVVSPNLEAFADFAMKRLLGLPGVKEVRSSLVLETLKDSTALPLDHLANA